LTANGKELARISRFFQLGLSNFQRGCLTDEQTFRIGASVTFIEHEFSWFDHAPFKNYEPQLRCGTFLEAKAVLANQSLAAFLPDFLAPPGNPTAYLQVRVPAIDTLTFHYRLAWNPRLLRLNPHAGHKRDQLCEALTRHNS
jgi:DNA-binding transcriptional LysR family regulator